VDSVEKQNFVTVILGSITCYEKVGPGVFARATIWFVLGQQHL
jgi:hypothetical protein